MHDRLVSMRAGGCLRGARRCRRRRARLDLPAKPGRQARQAIMEVRFMPAMLSKPRNGVAAGAVAELYRRRWSIEQLFRTLKTQGFDIEALRIEDAQPRCKLVMAALIAAITVQQLVHARAGKVSPTGALPTGALPTGALRP